MRRLFNVLDNQNKEMNYITTQNCREDIIGELDAIIQYEAHIVATDNLSAIATIRDIVKEEKLHVGQLFGLLFSLDPEMKEQFEKGVKEFKEENNFNR